MIQLSARRPIILTLPGTATPGCSPTYSVVREHPSAGPKAGLTPHEAEMAAEYCGKPFGTTVLVLDDADNATCTLTIQAPTNTGPR